ncbi:agmatinase [Acidobacteriota bacterium]
MAYFGGAIKKSETYDVAILGVPYDEKSSFLRGPAKGPLAIREACTEEELDAWTELGIDLEEALTMVDLGDLDVSGPFPQVSARIESKIFSVLEKEAVPIILGGDHSISYPIVKAMARKFGSLDILHFDAHPDLFDELYGDRYSHACPFTRILEDGLVKNLVQVGIRASIGEHWKKAAAHHVRMIEMKDFSDKLELVFANPLYISFDIDALDPAFAPGVSHRVPGGLSSRQAIAILHALKAEIVGMDMVEVNPDRDASGITASAAAKIVMEIAGKIGQGIQLKEAES